MTEHNIKLPKIAELKEENDNLKQSKKLLCLDVIELKKHLAEIKLRNNKGAKQSLELMQEIRELKQQLAEKDKEIKIYREIEEMEWKSVFGTLLPKNCQDHSVNFIQIFENYIEKEVIEKIPKHYGSWDRAMVGSVFWNNQRKQLYDISNNPCYDFVIKGSDLKELLKGKG